MPYDLHDLDHISCVGSVLFVYRSCTAPNGRYMICCHEYDLGDLDHDLGHDLSEVCNYVNPFTTGNPFWGGNYLELVSFEGSEKRRF